jgi:hypothetical protein
MSPQLQAFFQETPRASDPEAIFADHTPASGELASQVTQLNPDVVPEVNVELVLSQVLLVQPPRFAGAGALYPLGRKPELTPPRWSAAACRLRIARCGTF